MQVSRLLTGLRSSALARSRPKPPGGDTEQPQVLIRGNWSRWPVKGIMKPLPAADQALRKSRESV
jgi:hypothetical protein